jgi:hypothetical protein
LSSELQQLAKARSFGAFMEMPLPGLAACVGSTDEPAGPEAMRNAVASAIESLADDSTRAQARRLFPFGDTWWTSNLGDRQRDAADELYISPKAYTNVRDGSSHYRRVLGAIAAQLVALHAPAAVGAVAAPAPVGVGGADLTTVTERLEPPAARRSVPRWRRPTWRTTVAVAAIVAVVAGVAVIRIGDKRSGDTATPPAPCSIASGEAPATVAPADRARLVDLGDELRQLIPAGTCPAAQFGYFADALVQPLQAGDEKRGVVLVPPAFVADEPVYLPVWVWQSYGQIISGNNPETTVALAGYPVRVERQASPPAHLVWLSLGGVLIAADEDSPGFWIPSDVLPTWQSSGGLTGSLGFPATNPFVRMPAGPFVQEFERGMAAVDAPLPNRAPIKVVPVPPLGASLEPLGDLRGKILRQTTGTAWYVDRERRRRWIPDGETFGCLGGERVLAGKNVPGYDIWTLPPGPQATCDDDDF